MTRFLGAVAKKVAGEEVAVAEGSCSFIVAVGSGRRSRGRMEKWQWQAQKKLQWRVVEKGIKAVKYYNWG